VTSRVCRRKKLTEQYTLLRSSLEDSDRQLTSSKNEQRRVAATMEHLIKQRELVYERKQKIEDQILESINDQTTLEKVSRLGRAAVASRDTHLMAC